MWQICKCVFGILRNSHAENHLCKTPFWREIVCNIIVVFRSPTIIFLQNKAFVQIENRCSVELHTLVLILSYIQKQYFRFPGETAAKKNFWVFSCWYMYFGVEEDLGFSYCWDKETKVCRLCFEVLKGSFLGTTYCYLPGSVSTWEFL